MTFRDADAMIAWLSAVGFTEHSTYRDEADSSVVHHAEWVWAGAGGVMFGSASPDGVLQNAGRSAAYLVTADPDAFMATAVAAGSTVVREVVDNDYGGRGGSVEDPEGNHWSFGSYQPS
jgi:uncharacterized glyoxalase superfamily protein PhnB